MRKKIKKSWHLWLTAISLVLLTSACNDPMEEELFGDQLYVNSIDSTLETGEGDKPEGPPPPPPGGN